MTPSKLRDKAALRTVVAHAINISPDHLTDNQVYSFLLSELALLDVDDGTMALTAALGINSSLPRLFERRSELAIKLGRHPDTVERYENQGINSFAAHMIERSQQRKDREVTLQGSPLYQQELEVQAKATRAMTILGLSSHLSLADHGEDLMTYLESPRRPYMNAEVHITFFSSSRGRDWYRLRQSHTFQGGRESFRVAVVLNNVDGEQLMANGLVDDYHQLYNPDNFKREIKAIVGGSKFIIRNPVARTQKLLRLRELGSEEASRLLQSASKPLTNSCWLLEIIIPPLWQSEECIYKYLSTIQLQIGCMAYWSSPALMYLKKLTVEFSRFPDAERRTFFLQHFLGHAPGIFAEEHRYTLHLHNWIMPGHGVVLA